MLPIGPLLSQQMEQIPESAWQQQQIRDCSAGYALRAPTPNHTCVSLLASSAWNVWKHAQAALPGSEILEMIRADLNCREENQEFTAHESEQIVSRCRNTCCKGK